MKARFIKQIGTRGRLRIYWDSVQCKEIRKCDHCEAGHPHLEYGNTCPNSYGKGSSGIHNAYALIADKPGLENFSAFGETKDYSAEAWPKQCEYCGTQVPEKAINPITPGESGVILEHQVYVSRLYDCPEGQPSLGDVYEMQYHNPDQCPHWDNCTGIHTFGILPNGHEWDIDGRASNCTMREDKTHRCWVKQGKLEDGTLDVGKAGHTCSAGAGSIAVPGWHGFLRNFEWQG